MEKILILALTSIHLYAGFAVKSYFEIRNAHTVRQTYEESCGAASLATLINMIDFKNLKEKDILNKMSKKELNTNMVSFNELKASLDKMHYVSQGYKLDREIFEKIQMPILVKIENDPKFPHFVVAINHKGDFITIYDPSFGRYVSTKKEFYSVWDKYKKGGYALIVKPQVKSSYKPHLPSKIFFER